MTPVLFLNMLFVLNVCGVLSTRAPRDFLLLSVATNRSDGYDRFLRSADVYGIPVKILGMNKKWEGGDMKKRFKRNLLKEELPKYKDNTDKVIMFTDSYDVILVGSVDKILKKFDDFDARVVFGAEGFCWPDRNLKSLYPEVLRGKRFLNSGGFIGYAPELYEIVSSTEIENYEDDQLFYTKVFLHEELRNKLRIKLDHRSEIFQNLFGAENDVELRFQGREAYLENTAYTTNPLVVHGNGASKVVLNSLGNYLANSWNPEDGCISCRENTIVLDGKPVSLYPKVLIAIFIEQPTPFLEEFFRKVLDLNYPKNKVHLFVHNNVKFHEYTVNKFLTKHGHSYKSIKRINSYDNMKESDARNFAVDYCKRKRCDYYFNVDSTASLDNHDTLRLLVEQNRSVIAPILLRPNTGWSNVWGALNEGGYYARSADYLEIIENKRRGLWNIPYISSCYLINSSVINNPETRPVYEFQHVEASMAFCANMRARKVFLFASNRMDFGHLINPSTFNITKTNSELYQIFENRWDWEKRYIHKKYSKSLRAERAVRQPCPDVYWFPIVSSRFCREIIEIMETFGQWSNGSNKDPRLKSRYEGVPTRDIHMKQVGLAKMWDLFLEQYVKPLQESVFIGYEVPTRAYMNFVVRYRPGEQASLRPHHDASTYTINLALNKRNVDYKGGGCHFIRHNCSVIDTKVGWMLMHPGRLTHFHEGIPVTLGTRYIMISFVDP